MKIFIKLSNHPSSRWGETQISEANQYGRVVDLPFPQIHPNMTVKEVALWQTNTLNIIAYEVSAVMIQGEWTFSYSMIKRLRDANVWEAIYKRKITLNWG